MKENRGEAFSKSISYLFISQILIKLLGFMYSIYLINKPEFGDEGNAIYLSGYQFFSLILSFSSIGIPNAVSNLIAKCDSERNINKVFKSSIMIYMLFSCFGCISLFLFSDKIASDFIGINCVGNNLRLFAPIILFSTLNSIHIGFFNGIKQMKITAKIQFLEQLFKTIFTIGFVEILSKVSNNKDLLSIGATIAVGVSIIISFFICFYEKKKMKLFIKKFNEVEYKTQTIVKLLLTFSIPISIGAMLATLNKNIDLFFIMKLLSQKIGIESAKKIYGIIVSKVDVLILLPLAFNINFSTALIPNLSEAKSKSDYIMIKNIIEKTIFFSMVIGIGTTLGLFFFSDDIFYLLFSQSNDGAYLLKISSVSIFFAVLVQSFNGILQGLQKNRIPLYCAIFGILLRIIFNYILLNYTNLYGKSIVYSNIFSNCIVFFILLFYIKRYIKIELLKITIPIIIFGIDMIIIMQIIIGLFAISSINSKIIFIFSGTLGVVAYLLQILVFYRDTSFVKKTNL